jgi:hypothetical protein
MSKFGKIIFLTGVIFLVLSAGTIPFWNKFTPTLMNVVFGVMIGASALILAGEMFKYSGRRHEQKSGLTFMDYYLQVKSKRGQKGTPRQDKGGAGHCAFCGLRLMTSSIPAKLDGVMDLSISESQSGHCEECGKIACPQCSFRKGMSMGLKSFRCPACGGRVV